MGTVIPGPPWLTLLSLLGGGSDLQLSHNRRHTVGQAGSALVATPATGLQSQASHQERTVG